MELVGSLVDFGNAPEIHVDGIARIDLISPNIVRVTYFTRHIGPDGKVENRTALFVDWDADVWIQTVDRHAAEARQKVETARGIATKVAPVLASARAH